MILFLKAQRRGAAHHMDDLFGADPPRLPTTVMRRARTDKLGRFTPAHPVIVHKRADGGSRVIPLRPGTTEAQHRVRRDALEALASRVIARSGRASVAEPGQAVALPKTLGARMFSEFHAAGHAQLIGQRIDSAEDLAQLAEVYRDPRFETFRIVFTSIRGLVLGESAYSSRLPGMVVFGDDFAESIAADKARFGATSYWMIHNHPSGIPYPSPPDLKLTVRTASEVPGFQGHIIIDHQSYCAIDRDGNYTVHKNAEVGKVDFHGTPSVPHPLLSQTITSPQDAMRIATDLRQAAMTSPVLIMTKGSKGEVDLVMSFPLEMIPTEDRSLAPLQAWLRRVARTVGAGAEMFLIFPDLNLDPESITSINRLVLRNILTDVVFGDGSTSRQNGVFPLGTRRTLDARRPARHAASGPAPSTSQVAA